MILAVLETFVCGFLAGASVITYWEEWQAYRDRKAQRAPSDASSTHSRP